LVVRLRVRYEGPDDFIAEHDSQMVKGGLLIRGEPPGDLALFAPVEVELSGDFDALRAGIVLAGQVVQVVAGVGVAVAFDAAPLAAAVAAARIARPEPPRAPRNETAAKIQQALHGNKDERMRVLRDSNRMLHPYVLKNPGISLDEVLAIAKMTTLAPDFLASLAARSEWAQRPEVAIALIRNPKTPAAAAIRLLDFISVSDLRHLAKDPHTRGPVQQAARKKIL